MKPSTEQEKIEKILKKYNTMSYPHWNLINDLLALQTEYANREVREVLKKIRKTVDIMDGKQSCHCEVLDHLDTLLKKYKGEA